jgi:hypothetical protein
MRRVISAIAVASWMAFLAGCTSGGDNTAVVPPAPVVPKPQPSPSPGNDAIVVNTASQLALVRPTDPDTRIKQIKSGRNDPFEGLVAPKPPASSVTGSVSSPSGGYSPGSPSDPGSLPSEPGLPPDTVPTKPVLPPLPQPNEARGVKVSGVMVVGGVPRAIISAPGETVTRTVSVGDRLSNGQIIVKAIDANRPDPTVTLEQYGTDVVVGVGQQPVAALPSGAAPPLPAVR